jgi:coenzyme F420-dependent glucose-6-phosphate dehydrogenase
MTQFGYWLSSEEHGPADLIANARRAEEAGFSLAMVTDHFPPAASRLRRPYQTALVR